MPPKIRGWNLVNRRRNLPPADRIKDWTVFVNDRVQILSGKDAGKTGIISAVNRRTNAVRVKDCNMVVKHIKPNPDQPKGARILQEQFLPVTDVSLLDPSLSQPTSVRLTMAWNPVSERLEQTRISELSGLELPLPARVDPYKDQKEGELDTPSQLVAERTWTPALDPLPFPVPFLNELETWRRRRKESHVV